MALGHCEIRYLPSLPPVHSRIFFAAGLTCSSTELRSNGMARSRGTLATDNRRVRRKRNKRGVGRQPPALSNGHGAIRPVIRGVGRSHALSCRDSVALHHHCDSRSPKRRLLLDHRRADG
jgi:hypothetical protein